MLESGVYSSVLTYNDSLRVEIMDQKTVKVAKYRRKKFRAIRKGFVDKDRANERCKFFRVFLVFWGVFMFSICLNLQYSRKIFSDSTKYFKLKFSGSFYDYYY